MANGMKRKSFLFNIEWVEVLEGYPAEVRHEVLDGVMEYVRSGKIIEMKPLAKMAFSFIKRELDYNNERYDSMVSKRSEAGRKGGLSRGRIVAATDEGSDSEDVQCDDNADADDLSVEQIEANEANQANASFAKQIEANEANAIFAKHNDNDNEYQNQYQYENKKEIKDTSMFNSTDADASIPPPESEKKAEHDVDRIPYDKIAQLWNDTCKGLPAVIRMTNGRKSKIKTRVAEMGGVEKAMETLSELFTKITESPYLRGDVKNWRATFDWFFKNDQNWLKVIEGNYENYRPSKANVNRMNTNMTNFNNEGKRYEQF